MCGFTASVYYIQIVLHNFTHPQKQLKVKKIVCNGYWYKSAAARLSIVILRVKTYFMINITVLKFLILDYQSF